MLLADIYEPQDIVDLISKSIEVSVTPLNQLHMSDYFFTNYEGKRFQFSRKQAGELIGNIDEAEDQLRDYYNSAEYNCQIVEGLISPYRLHGVEMSYRAPEKASVRDFEQGHTFTYKVYPNGVLEGVSWSGVTYGMYQVWKHRLAMAGIETYQTDNSVETARLLILLYKNEQKPPEEHSTLRRVIRPRLQLKDATPFFKSLLYISHAYKLDIGEKRARALCRKFSSLTQLAIAPISEVIECEDIGKSTAKKLMEALRGEE